MSKPCVELGFIEKIESWKLQSKFFPSKVGGVPAWLCLDSLPSEIDMQCMKCHKPLIFLCQLYAPMTLKEDCFHRTLFIFICRDGKCNVDNDASNIKVFRSQLPRRNKFYSFEPPREEEEGSEKPSASNFLKICRICGSMGSKSCSNCKLVSYCSRDHQIADWKSSHKLECQNKELFSAISKASNNILFPEYEIDLEPEEIKDEPNLSEEDVMAEYEKMLRKGQLKNEKSEMDENDLFKMAAKETDKQFAKFRTQIDPYPDQVIRYDRIGQPLFVSSENIPEEIAPCEGCGEARKFEFQIMPQLLVHLRVDSHGQSIDWGTVLIFTCPNSCSRKGVQYIQEKAFKQDYTPSTDFLRM